MSKAGAPREGPIMDFRDCDARQAFENRAEAVWRVYCKLQGRQGGWLSGKFGGIRMVQGSLCSQIEAAPQCR